jgi:hypothetical protein
MKRIVLGIFALTSVSCGGSGSGRPDQTMQEQIALLNELTGVAANIRDDASAEAALPELDRVLDRVVAINKKWKSYETGTREKMTAKYQHELRQANQRLSQALLQSVTNYQIDARKIDPKTGRVRSQKEQQLHDKLKMIELQMAAGW